MTKSEATEGNYSSGKMRDGLPTQTFYFADGTANNNKYTPATSEPPPLLQTGVTGTVILTSGETKINLAADAALQIKVYRRRWVILALSFIAMTVTVLPWMQYVVLANVLTEFYGVSNNLLEWTTLIFSGMCMIFTIPCTWFANKYGLRKCFLIASLGTAVGQWVKVLGCWPDRFWVIFLGQTLVAVCFNFIIVIPPKIAAVWFPADELSTALGTAFIGESVGVAVGCAIAPLTARAEWTQEENMAGLFYVHIAIAIAATVILVAVFFLYRSKPPLPPSAAQAAAAAIASFTIMAFVKSMRRIVCRKSFLILAFGFTTLTAVNVAMRTLMIRALMEHFPEHVSQAAWLNTILTISGPVGIMGAAFILDRTKMFKEMTIIVYSIVFLAVIGYSLTIAFGTITLLYCVITLMGVFLSALYVPGLELAIELNYPEPEGNPSTLLNWMFQPAAMLVTTLASSIFSSYGANAGNGFLCGLVCVGFLAIMFVPKQYRRRDAELAAAALKQKQEREAQHRLHSPDA